MSSGVPSQARPRPGWSRARYGTVRIRLSRPRTRPGSAPQHCMTSRTDPPTGTARLLLRVFPWGVSRLGVLARFDEGVTGLDTSWYTNESLTGTPAAYTLGLPGANGGVISRDWGAGAPIPEVGVDNWSVRLRGTITFPSAGVYQFRTRADDGTQVWIDNNLIIDQWVPQAPRYSAPGVFTATAG